MPASAGNAEAGRVERLLELPVCRYDRDKQTTRHTSEVAWHG